MNAPEVNVKVAYQLGEYLSVLLDFLPFALTAKKLSKPVREVETPTVSAGLLTRISVWVVAPVVFFYKLARLGACNFSFHDKGFSRQSKRGTLDVQWDEIERVFRFSRAYLFVKKQGAMPVPYRCLTPDQRTGLESLLALVGHGAEEAA